MNYCIAALCYSIFHYCEAIEDAQTLALRVESTALQLKNAEMRVANAELRVVTAEVCADTAEMRVAITEVRALRAAALGTQYHGLQGRPTARV